MGLWLRPFGGDDTAWDYMLGGGACPAGFEDLCDRIAEAHSPIEADIANGADYVTVVVALPMTFEGGDVNGRREIREQIEGALAAHHLRNESGPLRVRMLLLDLGTGNRDWAAGANLVRELRDEERIVAVTGLGSSLSTTGNFIAHMQTGDTVVVGTVITGDSMLPDMSGQHNFTYRVSPTNEQETAVLAEYGSTVADVCSSFVVYDTAPPESGHVNDYIETLAGGFIATQRENCDDHPAPLAYDRREHGTFASEVEAICGQMSGDGVVYFAGRSRTELPTLLTALAGRDEPCAEHAVTVLTGDDANHVVRSPDLVDAMPGANVGLVYIGLAHPAMWDDHDGSMVQHVNRMVFLERSIEAVFGDAPPDLSSGQVIMAFDAFYLVAAESQRLAVNGPVTSIDLARHLESAGPFQGASGTFGFDDKGNPVRKEMVLLAATWFERDPVEIVDTVVMR